jgi:hypothetical protein
VEKNDSLDAGDLVVFIDTNSASAPEDDPLSDIDSYSDEPASEGKGEGKVAVAV